jgi:hypothetical protein
VLPYYIPDGYNEPQLCNTGIFKFNRFNYLGIDSPQVGYLKLSQCKLKRREKRYQLPLGLTGSGKKI